MKDSDLVRYSRHIMLPEIDIEGQKKISSSKISIVGLGGLGCSASSFLAASGVGTLNLIDDDFIDISNLQRQILFSEKDLNRQKALVAKKKLIKLNKEIDIQSQNLKLNAFNIERALKNSEIILDCTDNFDTRKLINIYCKNKELILISGSSQGWMGQFFSLDFKDDNSPCLECFFEDLDSEDLTCRESSIFSPLVGVIGSFMASESIKRIIANEKMNSELVELNLKENNLKSIKLKKNRNCKICSKL